jgi:predicted DNA-binding ribbon-helix-helix protein
VNTVVKKRSVLVAGRKTSVSLEEAFWQALKDIANERQVSVSNLVARIESARDSHNLSSALRLFVLEHYRSQVRPADIRAAA